MSAREDGLPMWVVYERPKDFPNCYVSRLWLGERPTEELVIASRLEDIHVVLTSRGLVKTDPQEQDDPCIKEVWL